MVRSNLPAVLVVCGALGVCLASFGCSSPEHPPMACLAYCNFDAGPDTREAAADAHDAAVDSAPTPDAPDALADTGPVGSNPCHNVAGNYARIEGEPGDSVFPGVLEAGGGTAATFTVVAEQPDFVTVRATRTVDGSPILFLFSTRALGEPLSVKSYPFAVRVDHESSSAAGFALTIGNRTCDHVGAFEILAISFDPTGSLRGLEATVTRECQDVFGTMTGCIKYGYVP